MSTTYEYAVAYSPDLSSLEGSVAASAMTDKSVEYSRWDEENGSGSLCVTFTTALDAGDKTILDGIVDDVPEEDPW